MTITFESEVGNGVLLITASGRDESVQEVIDYGQSVIDLAAKLGVTRVLCDERKLEYALNTIDTFEAGKEIAERAPSNGRVAVVCRPEFLEMAKFWENVMVNRFLHVHVDTDIDRARQWLQSADE
ncbi:MAG: hypothetical protein GC151_16540 [Betaproteobacteria bacterium]|nr:hypothetical protein [Betaproteobacteria bacterium]